MNAREYLEILHVAERLKDTPRHCTTTNGRTESVAEHSWRISLMAFLLRHEFKDLDIDKVVDMCLIHDLGECFTGDIPTFIKTDSDREVEDSLLNQWVKTLPRELSDDMAALYKEMDAQETKEAKLYKALDKLEALIQHNESPIDTWSENEYELNKTYAFDTVAFSEWLTNLRKAILDDTLEKIDTEGQNSGYQSDFEKHFVEKEGNMSITYRRLNKDDLDTFIQMRINQLREEGAKEDIDLTPALKNYYNRHISDGTFVSWLAIDGEKIIGTSGMSFVEKPPYFGCPSGKMGLLSSMFTDPSYRRQGIAKELLDRVIREAKEYGCGTVQITASDMGVKLYTAYGFVHNGNFMQYKLF